MNRKLNGAGAFPDLSTDSVDKLGDSWPQTEYSRGTNWTARFITKIGAIAQIRVG
jgi:hypothetical protein